MVDRGRYLDCALDGLHFHFHIKGAKQRLVRMGNTVGDPDPLTADRSLVANSHVARVLYLPGSIVLDLGINWWDATHLELEGHTLSISLVVGSSQDQILWIVG